MKLRYIGDDDRVYPALSLEVNYGDIVELEEDPGDGRWEAYDSSKPKEKPADADANGNNEEVSQ
jgi:hypothetical protein